MLFHPLPSFPELVLNIPRVTPKSLPTDKAGVRANGAKGTESGGSQGEPAIAGIA